MLKQFTVKIASNNVAHLIFDMPDRSMNVFSNAAIAELGKFAAWLKTSDVKGAVISSGKTNAFCAGADLTELVTAYDMIMAAPQAERQAVAYNHFFALSSAIRALETAGKPVAAAIGGLALGGGCELAMGAHFRVLADTPKAALGLPESLVGLLPGGGGTQRLPRLIGLALALPVLLAGGRLTGQAALDAGLVDALVPPGEELAAAERWVLTAIEAVQPWDRQGWQPPDATNAASAIETARVKILSETLGHYPAPLAILDCLAQGYKQAMDTAIRTEMTLFARLIQRPEPRDMIATMFLGKLDYERRVKAKALPAEVERATAALAECIGKHAAGAHAAALAEAGFVISGQLPAPVQPAVGESYWFDTQPATPHKRAVFDALRDIAAAASPFAAQLDVEEKRLVDYALVCQAGYPAYLGGPFAFQLGD